MEETNAVDVSRLIDEHKPGRFAVMVILSLWAIMFTDGYELSALSFAAPSIVKEWHISRAALGPVFGANIFGIMVGSILFGYVGDKLGRKRALILGAFWYGAFTLVTASVASVDHLLLLRFAAGIGIGGAVPNALVLVSEFAPKRLRATWVTLIFTGYTFGASFGGVVAAGVVPRYGWQAVFVIGGMSPLLLASWLAFVLPESLRFLVLKGRVGVERLARRIDPTLKANQTRFYVGGESNLQRFSLRMLFAGRLKWITPLLWLAFIANSMTLFVLANWLPILIEGLGVSANHAALVSSMFSIGGTVGGLAIMRLIDKHGARLIVVLPLIGFPIVAGIGLGLPLAALAGAVFVVGFCVAGTQFGLNAIASTAYPSSFRAKGTGMAIGIAKIGSISGPMLSGALLANHLPVPKLFVVAAVPVAIVAVLAFALGRAYQVGKESDDNVSLDKDVEPTRSVKTMKC